MPAEAAPAGKVDGDQIPRAAPSSFKIVGWHTEKADVGDTYRDAFLTVQHKLHSQRIGHGVVAKQRVYVTCHAVEGATTTAMLATWTVKEMWLWVLLL